MQHTYKLTRWLTGLLAILFLFSFGNEVKGQTTIFSEDMGSAPSTTAITAHTFQNSPTLTFTSGGAAAAADVRNSNASSGYTGASGLGNIWFTNTAGDRGFAIEGINAASFTNLQVQFGYRKESASALPTLALDYWNGTAYVNVPFTFNEAAGASTGWYLSPVINLPVAAQINGLRLRWVKSGTVAVRIDDVVLRGTVASAPPTVTTAPAASVTQTAAILGGNITNAGSPAPDERGIEYSTTDGFAAGTGITVSSTGTFGTGAFTESVTGLAPGTTYYFRAFATNTAGTARGDQESFTTSATATAPSVVTNAASSVTNIGATLNGEVVADGGEPVTARGFVYSDTQTTPLITDGISTNEPSGSGVGVFDATVSGLTPNTRYYVQAYATNTEGTSHGGVVEFVTVPNAPTVGTGSDATFNSITANWSAPSPAGNQTFTYTVQLSETSDFAVVVDEETGIASSTTSFEFTGLDEGTEYFFRVRAVNTAGNSDWSAVSAGYSTLINAVYLDYDLYSQNFATFVSAATLPAGWSLDNTYTYQGDFGSGTAGGLRGNGTLGFQLTASAPNNSFEVTLTLLNNTGSTISSLNVGYLGKVARTDQTGTPKWVVTVDGVEQESLEYLTSGGVDQTISAIVTGLEINDGDTFEINWFTTSANTSGTRRQIGISDVEVQVVEVASIAEGNGAGWRFLSSPVASTTFAQLLGPVWTQGDGIGGFNDPNSNQPNVRRYDPNDTYTEIDDQITNYIPVTNLGSTIGLGTGFAVYVFELDDLDVPTSNIWPKVLNVTGAPNTSDFDFDLNPSPGGDVFTLLGNPFASPIEIGGFTNIEEAGNSVYVYSSAAEEFLSHNGATGDLPGGRIAPFQGFFMFATGGSPTATAPTSAINTVDTTELYSDPTPVIQISATMEGELTNNLWFSFNDQGSVDRNNFDALMLYPLGYRPFIKLYAISNNTALDIKNLPIELGEAIEVPMNLDAWTPGANGYVPMTGEVTLTWPTLNALPLDWTIQLIDNETGAVVDLNATSSYSFTLGSNKNAQTLEHVENIRMKTVKSDFQNRFTLTIAPQTTSAPINGELPSVVSLSQNYPNPFNPTTQITYELPQSAEVRLDVFNVMGQRVATLVNASQNAGAHTVTFDAANLSSGVYVYRLQAGATVLTRKMTLVK